jgi:hypothetical protein
LITLFSQDREGLYAERSRSDTLEKENAVNYWRMRMRKKEGGEDMFPQCLSEGVAAIHYTPVESVDLSLFSEEDLPPEWAGLESPQSGNLKKFAWRIRGGDVIYVATSHPSRIVGVGRVRGTEDTTAYQYLSKTPIVDKGGAPWRHTISVDWEQVFTPVRHENPRAPMLAVLDLTSSEVAKIQRSLREGRKVPRSAFGGTEGALDRASDTGANTDIQVRLVENSGYTRYSKEAIRAIERRHATLCNRFTEWLQKTRRIICDVERRNIDVTFRLNQQKILVEFKIAYHSDPKPAIREALGQILAYNFYPDRIRNDHWILVLDCAPTEADHIFLERIREFNLPLSYGWLEEGEFRFSAECPLLRA